jgi:toxin ParE1/3/4
MAAKPGWRLTAPAADDLDSIFDYSVERWSLAQAERYADDLRNAFDLLASFPGLARERFDVTPPIRVHPVGSHRVLYRQSGDDIEIIRVLHARQDWLGVLD